MEEVIASTTPFIRPFSNVWRGLSWIRLCGEFQEMRRFNSLNEETVFSKVVIYSLVITF